MYIVVYIEKFQYYGNHWFIIFLFLNTKQEKSYGETKIHCLGRFPGPKNKWGKREVLQIGQASFDRQS